MFYPSLVLFANMKRFLLLICLIATPFFSLHAKDRKKIALLFLTIQDIHQTDLWKYLLTGEGNRFNIYIHSKHHLNDPFFRDFRIVNRVATTWNEHIEAWRRLLRNALNKKENVKFIFLSDSCIPLWPLKEIYEKVMKNEQTYMMYMKPFWPRNNAREVLQLPREHRWVNSEWVILNREHATLLIQDESITKLVKNHPHSGEAFISCVLSYYNYLNRDEVINQQTTFADFNLGHDSHPYRLEDASEFNLNLLRKAKVDGYFFARKVAPQVPWKALLKVVQEKVSK